MCNCIVLTTNFTCKNCVYFHSQCDRYVSLMRHTIKHNCIHVEITYVFDTCKIDFFYNKCKIFFMNNNKALHVVNYMYVIIYDYSDILA